MYRRISLVALSFSLLVMTIISSANAAPALNIGSNASYHVSGSLQIEQSCSTDNTALTQQACYGIILPPQQDQRVYIIDSGRCFPYDSSSSCFFSPSYLYAVQGTPVTWLNSGVLNHTVTSDPVGSFDSGKIFSGRSYNHTFTSPGTFYYHCEIHPWMNGTIQVNSPPPPPTPPPATKATVDGTVGWSVLGVDSNRASLKVNHDLTLTVSPALGLELSPVHEFGSFEQSVDLASRLESPGAATAIVEKVLSSLALPYSGLGGGYRMGGLSNQKGMYTSWWVNGPLALGSQVQVLSGWTTVTGEENVAAGSVGSRQGWLLTSEFNQNFDTSIPSSSSYMPNTSHTSMGLKLAWAFDKRADLLLRFGLTGGLESRTVSHQSVRPCTYDPQCITAQQVTVTRTITVNLTFGAKLSSTNLSMNSRTRGVQGTSTSNSNTNTASPLQTPLASLSWMSLGGTSTAAAGLLGLAIWFVVRGRKKGPGSIVPT